MPEQQQPQGRRFDTVIEQMQAQYPGIQPTSEDDVMAKMQAVGGGQ